MLMHADDAAPAGIADGAQGPARQRARPGGAARARR